MTPIKNWFSLKALANCPPTKHDNLFLATLGCADAVTHPERNVATIKVTEEILRGTKGFGVSMQRLQCTQNPS